MVVECPTCHTRYRLDDALVAGKNPLLQCSFDNYLFRLSSSSCQELDSTPQENQPLNSFPSSRSQVKLGNEERDSKERSTDFIHELPDLSTPLVPSQRSTADGGLRPESRLALQEPKEPSLILPPQATSFSLRSLLVLLTALALCYGVFSLYLFTHPSQTGALLARLPLVGKVFVTDHLSPGTITLTNLQGRYQQIKNNRQAFIISGQAVNTTPATIHSIQVEGRIFNGNGGEVGRKTIFCGNEISIKVVEKLSSQEISILQKLVPPKHFGVPADEAAKFLIIFTNPPAGIKEFSCRVMTVQKGSHESTL